MAAEGLPIEISGDAVENGDCLRAPELSLAVLEGIAPFDQLTGAHAANPRDPISGIKISNFICTRRLLKLELSIVSVISVQEAVCHD